VTERRTTPEAARLLGVGETTIKRWVAQERLKCVTTPGGHRRFERAEIERFRHGFGGKPVDVVFQIVEHLFQDSGTYGLQSCLIELRGRLGSWSQVADVLGAALGEVGRRWEQESCSVAEEHNASRRFQQALWACGAILPSSPKQPCCILAAVEGEEHTLGLSLAEICLSEAGWSSLWLGSPTPTSVLVEAIHGFAPAMVAVSASPCSNDSKVLLRHYRPIADACRSCGAMLVLGGEGAWPDNPSRGHRVRSFAEFAELLIH
jgi:excisionase family DNA binding protein